MIAGDNARIYNGRMYTVITSRNPWTGKKEMGWVLNCDGYRVGHFATKKELWQHVEMVERGGKDAQCKLSLQVERESSIQAGRLLDMLHLFHGLRN